MDLPEIHAPLDARPEPISPGSSLRWPHSSLSALAIGFAIMLSLACMSVPRSTLNVNDQERSFYVRLPENYSRANASSQRYPLIIQLHGGGGNAESAETMSQMTEQARERGFIVAYPDGFANPLIPRFKTWNANHCCGQAMRTNSDDVAFLSGLLDYLLENYPIDPNRVYLCGMSNGGMMTYRAALNLGPRLAGIGIVAGAMFGDESPPDISMPAIIIHGEKDEAVPFRGGSSNKDVVRDNMEGTFASVEYAARFWAQNNGCKSAPNMERSGPDRSIERWSFDCPAGSPVEVYALKEGKHAWPGGLKGRRAGDEPVDYLDASKELLDFFENVRR
ncbi:MAG: dienelactone hydrolase family protein [Leptospiraceae bacterium]|nr:dienelactone hydrolase family protein [Leptospiraceae bacterium]